MTTSPIGRTPTNAVGQRVHQLRMVASSVVASDFQNTSGVFGLPLVLDRSGRKDGQPGAGPLEGTLSIMG